MLLRAHYCASDIAISRGASHIKNRARGGLLIYVTTLSITTAHLLLSSRRLSRKVFLAVKHCRVLHLVPLTLQLALLTTCPPFCAHQCVPFFSPDQYTDDSYARLIIFTLEQFIHKNTPLSLLHYSPHLLNPTRKASQHRSLDTIGSCLLCPSSLSLVCNIPPSSPSIRSLFTTSRRCEDFRQHIPVQHLSTLHPPL